MGSATAEVNQRGQEPVDEDELVFCTGTDSSRGREASAALGPLVPQRADLSDEFSDHL